MKDTKISLVSGTDYYNALLNSDERINQKCLQMLAIIDKENSDYYKDIAKAIVGKDNTALETMGYVFAYDYLQGIPSELIIKDALDILASSNSYTVSDTVKNSDVFAWWNDIIIKGNRIATKEELDTFNYLYDSAIHYLYAVVDDATLSKKAIEKKNCQIAVLSDTSVNINICKIIISYSIYEHLHCSPVEVVDMLRTTKIGDASSSLEVSDIIKNAAKQNEDALRAKLTEGSSSSKTGSVADDVSTYTDAATKLSEEIRKWFGKSDTSTYVYNGNNYTPSSTDYLGSNMTSIVMIAGGALVLLALLFKGKKQKI